MSRPLAAWSPAWRAPDNASVLMVGHPTRLWGFGLGVRTNGPGVTATISDRGLREPEPTIPRPAGRERVLVLGDSTFFGHGVGDDDTLGRQLEAELQARGIDTDSANGAISGYSTEQTRVLLDEVGWSLEPTVLVIGSLWSDNNADGFRDMDLLRTVRLAHANPLLRSAFFQLVVAAVDGLRGPDSPHLVTWPQDGTYPAEGVRRVPLDRYAANLDAMVSDARARGVGVVFVAPCNQVTVEGRLEGGAAWDPYFEAMEAVARHQGVPEVKALEALRAAHEPVGELFVDVLHPNARGLGLIARAVADRMLAEGWPGARLIGQASVDFPADTLVDTGLSFVMSADASSPQSWLFPGREAPSASAGAAHPNGGGEGSGASSGDPAWTLKGRIVGAGAVEVTVKDGTRLLATRSLADAGWFDVSLSPEVRRVQVEAQGPGGSARVEASFDAPAITLRLGR